MRIAVTTPTGHVGSQVANHLLNQGAEVILLARRPAKLRQFVARGAKVAVGSQDDDAYLTEATEGVDAFFWLTPPGAGSDNVRAFQNRLGRAAGKAIRANRIPRVVNLSSLGAQSHSGAGLVNGLHDVEGWLEDAAENVVHLRPGFFYENLLMQIDSLRTDGAFYLPISGSRRFPMIACRDIARRAADRLMDGEWTGRWIQELHGPADLSFDEAAAALSQGLGRKVVFVRCDPEQTRQALIFHGMSENAASLLLELYDAAESGRLKPTQSRTSQTTTPTTLVEFAREVVQPLMIEAAPAT